MGIPTDGVNVTYEFVPVNATIVDGESMYGKFFDFLNAFIDTTSIF